MVKPVSTSKETSAATAPVVTQVKTDGRLIEPFKIDPNYRLTASVFNAQLKSSNVVARGAERAAYAVAALVVAVFQTLDNIFRELAGKGLADMVIFPINEIHNLVKKEKTQTAEVEMAPAVSAEQAVEVARKLEEQPVVSKTETPAQPQPAQRGIPGRILDKVMAHKRALAIAAIATATGIAAYCYAPLISSTISSLMGGASSASNFSNFSNFSQFGSNFSNFAGSNFGSSFVV